MGDLTPDIAQLRWRNVANVGMVAVGTTTLAQLRWHNVGMVAVGTTTLAQRHLANVAPTSKLRCVMKKLALRCVMKKLVIKMVLNLNVPFT